MDDRYQRESWYGETPDENAARSGGGGRVMPQRSASEDMAPLGARPPTADLASPDAPNSVFAATPTTNAFPNGPPTMGMPVQRMQPPQEQQQYTSQQPPATASALFGAAQPPPMAQGYQTQQPAYGQQQQPPPQQQSTPAVFAPTMAPPPLQGNAQRSTYAQQPSYAPQPAAPPPASGTYASSQWGSQQLPDLPLKPISQPERNALRGWNDPPKPSSRTRAPVAAMQPLQLALLAHRWRQKKHDTELPSKQLVTRWSRVNAEARFP